MLRASAFTTVLVAALALSACGKDDKAKAEKAPGADPVAAADKSPQNAAAKPAGEMAREQPGGDNEIADLGGLQPNAVPAASLQELDGVAQFSLGDDKLGCVQYGKDMAGFFTNFQTEFGELEANFQPNAQGVAAMRKFAGFLRKSSAEMTSMKVEGDDLSRAHLQFVATVDELAGGFEDLASALEAQDEGKTTAAAGRVQGGVGKFKSSLDALVTICGE